MIANLNLIKNTKAAEDEQLIRTYQSNIGTQMWAYVFTRHDLGFLVSTLSRFSSNPAAEYCVAVKGVYRYLHSTKDYKLVY